MELPHLGQHCSEVTCNLLDFLPVKCDACNGIFCKDHLTYSSHNCQSIYKKDRQVPLCPLCNAPVPTNRNELPDIKVSEHMDRDCRSNTKKKKVFNNKCSATGCKIKELIPLKCDNCKQNYCLKHRHPHDHTCKQSTRSAANFAMSQPGAAAMARTKSNQNAPKNKKIHKNTNSAFQPSMNEDEALARALQMSMLESTPQTPESEDHLLAKALAESEEEFRKQQSRKNDSSCSLS